MFVVLKNGFRFKGHLVGETAEKLILDDFKVGRVEISKAEIAAAARTEVERHE